MTKKYLAIIILAAIGIFNAFYLSYEAWIIMQKIASAGILGTLPCDLNDTFSCSSILAKPESRFFGVPFPMIAAVVYPVLFALAVWGYVGFSKTPAKILTFLAGGGIIFNSIVIFREYSVGVFCPLCLVCSVLIVTIFIIAICIWRQPVEIQVKKVRV